MLLFPKTLNKTTKTFTVPPLHEDRLLLPELYDFHFENSPDHPVFVYADNGVTKSVLFKDFVPAIHRASYLINEAIQRSSSSDRKTVVAILANAETITYAAVALGVLRAGYTVFMLSPRNNAPAITFLLEKVGATHLIVSSEPALRAVSSTALARLAKPDSIPIIDIPVFDTLFPSPPVEFKPYPKQVYERQAAAIILHSSGSTSFPKPIIRTHAGLLEPGRVPWFGDINLTGVVNSAHMLPVFHGFGFINVLLIACSGLVMSVFKPSNSMPLPTPENVMAAAKQDGTRIMVSVPNFVEAWSRTDEGVEFLKSLEGAIYAGGPLNRQVGDKLAEQGVQIHCVYATTETAPLSKYLRNNPGRNWEYFEFSPHVNPTFVPYEDGDADNIFEVVIKRNSILIPMTVNSEVDGIPAYATSDLVQPHPTIPGLYRIHGRADDQIMLSTGEKTNPGPLETILSQDLKVHAAVIFGREKICNGVIICPKPEFAFDPRDVKKLVQFRDDIWPTVERMNAFAPKHSRLFKEMILVESPLKPFQFTAKSTVRRQFMISEYDEEISNLYENLEAAAQESALAPDQWTKETTLEFVRNAVIGVMAKAVEDDADVFQHGCDSLQSTWIRNAVVGAIKKTINANTANLVPQSMMYQYPTIAKLAAYVLDLASTKGASLDPEVAIQKKLKEMDDMLEKYTASFPLRPAATQLNSLPGDVILLTGSTGGFGSGLLHNLVTSSGVRKVYALNRKSPSGQSLEERQKHALVWDEDNLIEQQEFKDKFVLVETETSKDKLGISDELYAEMLSSVTHIIHNAWRVDFNLSLTSFESSIRGIKNLVDFALRSSQPQPPRLLFISSVGIFNRPDKKGLFMEEPMLDARSPIGTGYGEAKWIGEQILSAAAKETELRPIVVRLGQIAGNKDGYWNEREWLPSIVKSALSLNCLPDAKGNITWMPSFYSSKALTELRNSEKPFLHLVHPRGITWSTMLGHFAKALAVPLVPFEDWLAALQSSLADPAEPEAELMLRNPALRLVTFYSNVSMDEDREPLGIVRMDPSNAVSISPTLQNLKPLGEEEARAWLDAWKRAGFI